MRPRTHLTSCALPVASVERLAFKQQLREQRTDPCDQENRESVSSYSRLVPCLRLRCTVPQGTEKLADVATELVSASCKESRGRGVVGENPR